MAKDIPTNRSFAFVSSTDTGRRKNQIVRNHLSREIKRAKSVQTSKLASSDESYPLCKLPEQLFTGASEEQDAIQLPIKVASTASPQIFDTVIGTASLDPFHTQSSLLPPEITSELFTHSIITCFEGIRPHPPEPRGRSDAQAWLAASTNSPVLLNAILFGSSYHMNEKLDSKPSLIQLRTTWTIKAAVVQHLQIGIALPPEQIEDATLAAIWILSGHNTRFEPFVASDGSIVRPPAALSSFKFPFPRALTTLQRIDLLGDSPFLQQHVDALVKVVNARGGLSALGLAGLPELVSAADIVHSTLTHSPPRLSLSAHKSSILGYHHLHPIYDHDTNPNPTKSSVYALPDSLQDLTTQMRHYASFINLYIKGQIVKPNLSALADWRNRIQHTLLSTLTYDHTHNQLISISGTLPQIYRAGLFIYSHLVIFPLSESCSARLLKLYVSHVLLYIDRDHHVINRSITRNLSNSNLKILLWSVTLAAIATTATKDNPSQNTGTPKASPERILSDSLQNLLIDLDIKNQNIHSKALSDILWCEYTLSPALATLWYSLHSLPEPGNIIR